LEQAPSFRREAPVLLYHSYQSLDNAAKATADYVTQNCKTWSLLACYHNHYLILNHFYRLI